MNPINLTERIAALPELDEDGNPQDFAVAREIIALMRLVLAQFAARALRLDCHCCTCNARRLLDKLAVPHG